MENFLQTLLGTTDFGTFAALFVLGVFGAICGLAVKYLRSTKKNNPLTPDTFSFGFLIRDNLLRFLCSILLILPVIRFSSQFIGSEATTWGAFFYGLSLDQLIALFARLQDTARPAPTSPVGEVIEQLKEDERHQS
jgi:hypothetical protein